MKKRRINKVVLLGISLLMVVFISLYLGVTVKENADMKAASPPQLILDVEDSQRVDNTCQFKVVWHWEGKPVSTNHDSVTISLSDNYYALDNCSATIFYTDGKKQSKPIIDKIEHPIVKENGLTFDFEMIKKSKKQSFYAQSGEAIITMVGDYSPEYPLALHVVYQHQRDKAEQKHSFNLGPITFSFGDSEPIEKIEHSVKIDK